MSHDEPRYPVELCLSGHRCLVVGGGTAALGEVYELLGADAKVDVIAPDVLDDIAILEGVSVQRRPYRRSDVGGHRLVIAASDDARVNRQVVVDGDEAGALVCAPDHPDISAFTLPSVVRRGALTVSVGTGAHNSALSVWIRDWLEAELGPEYGELLEVFAEVRDEMIARGESIDRPGWQFALDSGMLELVRVGRRADAKERLRKCLSSSSV